LLATFNTRDFGANGFYASPDYIDQYEETQTSLIALSSTYHIKNVEIKPRISWRRNQDMYLFLRYDPDYFRNFHISNKISAEANMVFSSNLGKTGFGIDLSKVYLVSSNLGDHNRTMITSFLEHRFEFDKFDVTPGIAITHFSDFGTKAFPGIDVGVTVDDNFKLYGNIGYTYRIPTYTDLYYNGPTTQGNPNLKPESALSEELCIKYTSDNLQLNVALFNRTADNLIDWTKENEADKWQTKNFSKVVTKGVETSISYSFKIKDYKQLLHINYSFIDDDIKNVDVAYTRYSLNSIKHQLSSTFTSKFFSFLDQSISYRLVERTDGETYNVVDAKLSTVFNKVELFFNANNIFNTVYTETNLVPMPKSNVMIGVSYNF
jgi:iron complex outermembrane receptor protein